MATINTNDDPGYRPAQAGGATPAPSYRYDNQGNKVSANEWNLVNGKWTQTSGTPNSSATGLNSDYHWEWHDNQWVRMPGPPPPPRKRRQIDPLTLLLLSQLGGGGGNDFGGGFDDGSGPDFGGGYDPFGGPDGYGPDTYGPDPYGNGYGGY